MAIEKRFIFSGSALAFAGRIRRPDDVFLKVAAPSHLPVTGGLSEARLEGRETEPYHYKDVIRFSEAHSRAHGDFSDAHRAVEFTRGNHGHNALPSNTSVQARLHRLRIDVPEDPAEKTPRRIFHSGLLDLHMESTSDRRNPISFRSLSAKFEGITLTTIANGKSSEAELTVHTATKIFEENDTKQKLLRTYAGDVNFRKAYAACFHPMGTHLGGRRMGLFRRHEIPHADLGPIIATIVTKLEWAREAPEGTEIRNNRLSISGIGRIYFGEIILDENFRRVTLLRFELGSPNGGDASACEAATNGTPWPPHKSSGINGWLCILLLLLLACGRTENKSGDSPEVVYSAIFKEIDHGDFKAATLASKQAWLRTPDTEWAWRFKLQYILTLIYTRKLNSAEDLLRQDLPRQYAAVQPRYQYVKAYLQYCRGNPSALSAVRSAVDAAAAQSDWLTEADGLCLLAGADNQPGAQQLAEKALAIAKRNRLAFQEAAAEYQIGWIILHQHRYADAIPYFMQTASLAKRLQAHYFEVASLGDLGECYFSLGDLDRAFRSLMAARPLLSDDAIPSRISVNNELGSLYSLRRKNAEAIHYFREAFAIANSDPALSGYAPSANNLSEALIEAHALDEAEKYNELARQSLQIPVNSDPDLVAENELDRAAIAVGRGKLREAESICRKVLANAKIQAPNIQWSAHAQLAFIEEGLGKISKARDDFSEALAAIESNRSQQKVADYQITFLSTLIRFYQQYVDFLLRQHDPKTALAVADSSRASVLTQRLISSRQLPDFAARIQKQAHDTNSALLFYWLAPTRSYVWAITPRGSFCEKLPSSAAEIEQDVHSYERYIQEERADLLTPANPVGIRLYDTLVGPVAAYLKPDMRVVIVPDGPLHGLNFETLLVNGGKPHYWLDDVTVKVAPSLGILLSKSKNRAASAGALIVGDPIYQGTEYPDLPASGPEVGRVSSLFPKASVVLTRQNAKVDGYRYAHPELFSLIHFSAHVDASAQSPLDSAIILSQSDKGMQLYARDVMTMPLNADLVTVSGCRSSGSAAPAGEGMVGFAWAALEAGARNAVTSLWAVDDKSTADLMDHFYSGVIAGKPYSQALRDAKRRMLASNNPKPYYWAPFQLYSRNIGNNGHLAHPR